MPYSIMSVLAHHIFVFAVKRDTRRIKETGYSYLTKRVQNDFSISNRFSCYNIVMPSYKLHYFDIRGKGELCRLCFVAKGVLFDDVRIQRGEWTPERKAETPFGQLPYLEIDGQKFAQSLAIAQYISREYGLYGESSLEALAIDGITGLTTDYFSLWRKSYWMEDSPEKTKLKTKLKEEDLPKFLGNLEKLLTGNPDSGYYVGSKLTLADLAVYDVLENSYRDFPEVYEKFPKVVENRKKIASLAQMQIYLMARKETEI